MGRREAEDDVVDAGGYRDRTDREGEVAVVVGGVELLLPPFSPVMLLRRWPTLVAAGRVLLVEMAEYLLAADRAPDRREDVSVLGDDPVPSRIPERARAASALACNLLPESLRSALLPFVSPFSSPAPTEASLFCTCGTPLFPSLPSGTATPATTSVPPLACWPETTAPGSSSAGLDDRWTPSF